MAPLFRLYEFGVGVNTAKWKLAGGGGGGDWVEKGWRGKVGERTNEPTFLVCTPRVPDEGGRRGREEGKTRNFEVSLVVSINSL